jgi:hypothetical protein
MCSRGRGDLQTVWSFTWGSGSAATGHKPVYAYSKATVIHVTTGSR